MILTGHSLVLGQEESPAGRARSRQRTKVQLDEGRERDILRVVAEVCGDMLRTASWLILRRTTTERRTGSLGQY